MGRSQENVSELDDMSNLSVYCYLCEIALKNPNLVCWSSTKLISSISYEK